jgi:hypothetical protein
LSFCLLSSIPRSFTQQNEKKKKAAKKLTKRWKSKKKDYFTRQFALTNDSSVLDSSVVFHNDLLLKFLRFFSSPQFW